MSAAAQEQRQLVIIHSNDAHSCILPMNANLEDRYYAGNGGFLRRITMLNEERRQHPDLLYFDSGDFCQGSAYYTLFKGDVEIELMNRMHLDATTLGNHEWDYGIDNLARLIRKATFPVVCSNYDFKGTVLDSLVRPYIIIERSGVKIGVFALCPKLEGLVDLENCPGVGYRDPIPCALETATMLKEREHCDVVICISHLGWSKADDKAMIAGSRYIDLVLGGHSHTRFEHLHYADDMDGHAVPVDQNGKSAVYVGKITLTLEK